MIYFGLFKNIKDEDISVVIGTNGDSALVEGDTCYDDYVAGTPIEDVCDVVLEFGEVPVEIEGNSDGLFAPLKPYSATITIITKQVYEDLYSGTAQGVDVAIRNESTNKSLFYGFITPCAYNQGYTYLDELELEFVSPISALEHYKYMDDYKSAKVVSVYDVIKKILGKTNFYKSFLFPKLYNKEGRTNAVSSAFLKDIYVNEYNFVEDDDEHTVKDCKEVLEWICTYFGVSLVEYNTTLYFLDYNALTSGILDAQNYNTTTDAVSNATTTHSKTLALADYFDGGGDVSYDEVFNKISCSCNLYEAEGELVDVYEGMQEVSNEDKTTMVEGTDYLAMEDSTLQKEFNGVWEIYDTQFSSKHQKSFIKYYRNTPNLTTYWYNKDTSYSTVGTAKTFADNYTYKYIDTQNYIGAILCKTSANKSDVSERVSSIDFDDAILISNHRVNTHNVYGNYTPNEVYAQGSFLNNISKEGYAPTQKVFTYKEKLVKPIVDNDYLCINFKGTYYDRPLKIYEMEDYGNNGDTNKNGRWIWMEVKVGNYYIGGKYSTAGGTKYGIPCTTSDDAQEDYFDAWYWTTTPSLVRFYWEQEDKYNGKELKLCSNITWDKFIDKNEGVAFSFNMTDGSGTTPVFNVGDEISVSMFRPHAQNDDYRCDCVFIGGFEVQVLESSINNVIDKDDDDVVYTNETVDLVLNSDIVDEFDDLELDINTQCEDRIYSYSSVLNSANSYNKYIYNKAVDKLMQPQEYNLIEQYYKHYKKPRVIFNANLDCIIYPFSIIKESNLNKRMVVDSYSFNVLNDSREIKLIEYGD